MNNNNNLVKIDGLIILPEELMPVKEKSILVYPTKEENKKIIDSYCYYYKQGIYSKNGACDKASDASDDAVISVDTINRILKHSKIAEEYCLENDINIMKTNYKHVYKAAKKIRSTTTDGSANLVKSLKQMIDAGNFQALKFLLENMDPENFGSESKKASLANLTNNTTNNTNQNVQINVVSLDAAGEKQLNLDQTLLLDHIKELKKNDPHSR